jgi:hypothetical protein
VSQITGYSLTYLQNLLKGPEFQDLLGHYGQERKRVFDVTLERMKSLGIASLEKLEALLEDETEVWTKRELMEMAELMLVKPSKGAASGASGPGGSGSGVVVNVQFVAGEKPDASGPLIEGQASGPGGATLEWEP